jgi:hypothetical protein
MTARSLFELRYGPPPRPFTSTAAGIKTPKIMAEDLIKLIIRRIKMCEARTLDMLEGSTEARSSHEPRFIETRAAFAIFLSTFCFLTATCFPLEVFAQPRQRSVLVLDQSSAGLPFNTAVATAIRMTLIAESKSPISFYSEHLDANRFFGRSTKRTSSAS